MALEIESVQQASIAEQLGLEAGDVITQMGGEPLRDCIDALYFEAEAKLSLVVRKKDGSLQEMEIEKEEYESLGIQFIGDGLGKSRGWRQSMCILFCGSAAQGDAENPLF